MRRYRPRPPRSRSRATREAPGFLLGASRLLRNRQVRTCNLLIRSSSRIGQLRPHLRRLGGPGTPAMHPAVDHPEADQNKHRSTDGPTHGGTIAIVPDAYGEKENGQGQSCPVEGPVQSVGYRRLVHSSILADTPALHQTRAHHETGGSPGVHAAASSERRRPTEPPRQQRRGPTARATAAALSHCPPLKRQRPQISPGPLACCALGRIRTCNLLIRSQMLYPLSYECLAFRAFSPRLALREQHYMTCAVTRNPLAAPLPTCGNGLPGRISATLPNRSRTRPEPAPATLRALARPGTTEAPCQGHGASGWSGGGGI